MDQEETIDRIDDTLERLDGRLAFPGFQQSDPDHYQMLLDKRNELDDKRVQLMQADFDDDDIQFQQLTVDLNAATDQLNNDIKAQKRIDDIITDVTKLCSTADEILKLF